MTKKRSKRINTPQGADDRSRMLNVFLKWRILLSRYLNPQRWSLRGRFLYMSGTLLVLGNLILIFYISHALDNDIVRDVTGRLDMLQQQAVQAIDLHGRLLEGSIDDFAATPSLVRAFEQGDLGGTSLLMHTHAAEIRRRTGLQSIRLSFSSRSESLSGASPSPPVRPGPEQGPALSPNSPGVTGVDVTLHGPALVSVQPVYSGSVHIGSVTVECRLREILDTLRAPQHATVTTVLHRSKTHLIPQDAGALPVGEWLLIDANFPVPASAMPAFPAAGGKQLRSDNWFHLLRMEQDIRGQGNVALLFSFDAARMLDEKWDTVSQFAWLFIVGAMMLWTILYLNVRRLERFLARLKKIILSSHSNYFAERFESDPGHCLEMMHCTKESCPVYKDPSLVCYLETGSEAISPKWRNTCVFLDTYESCANCPVYMLRRGDEITEMRNVVNTMMGLWSNFLSRVGQLLTYVFRSQDYTEGNVPSLDEISARLEQLASLTFFGQDLQGVRDKEEIYRQLNHVFTTNFNIPVSIFFEMDDDADKFKVAHDNSQDRPLCKKQVRQSAEACRVKRGAEEVLSYYNPEICPYFNCDFETEVRCCLPIIMSGQVGGVFSFVAPKAAWPKLRRQLPVIRKYLDESAPVLSSIRLLMLTREQSLRDPLTQTRNRRFLEEFLTSYEPLALREKKRAGILMLDLDHFKRVNDEFGHEAGDAVLKQVVQVVTQNIRRSDLIIRYGGEEFLVFMRNTADESVTMRVAEKIRLAVEEHRFALPDGQHIHMTVTIGLALHPDDAPTVQEVIKFADVALYQGKNSGRNTVVRFRPDMWDGESK